MSQQPKSFPKEVIIGADTVSLPSSIHRQAALKEQGNLNGN